MDSEIYPVFYYNGQRAGELRVGKEGLMTVIEADCGLREGVVRLAVYGGGAIKSKTLGVLIPEGGRLRLKKRYSRAQMELFPSPITHAAPEGEAETLPPEAPVEAAAPVEAVPVEAEAVSVEAEAADVKYEALEAPSAGITAAAETMTAEAAVIETPGIEEGASEQRGSLIWWPEPTPWSLFSDTSLKAACREVRGALMTFELDVTLLAIPVEDEFPALPIQSPAEVRVIAGRRYAIVKVKDGAVYAS